MLAPNPSQHLESQSVSQRNPSRFHQSVKRSKSCGFSLALRVKLRHEAIEAGGGVAPVLQPFA